MDRTAFARFGPGTNTFYSEPDGVVWLGRADNRFVRFDTSRASAAAPVTFSALIRRVTLHNDRLLFGGGAAGSGPLQLDAASNALRIEFAAPGYVDESITDVPVQARRPRDRLVGVDPRSPARLHQPGLRRLPLPRPRPRRLRRRQPRGRLRLHDSAAVVPHVAGLRQLRRCCSRSRRSAWTACNAAASWARNASARALPRRSCGPRPPRRWHARRAKARRTSSCSSEHRPRDHLVARLRDHLRQALRADESARRRRRVRRRPVPPGPPRDRIPAGDREGQALRAVHARHDRPRSAAGVVHRAQASRSSSTTCRRSTAATSRATRSAASCSKTAPTRSSRSRSSTCRSSPRSACSASSRSRASRSTPTPSTT